MKKMMSHSISKKELESIIKLRKDDEALTAEEVARMLKKSKKAVLNRYKQWVAEGRCSAFLMDGKVTMWKSEVLRLIASWEKECEVVEV